MGIGARDHIDRLLVEKYISTQVDNHSEDAFISKVAAEDMLSAMNASAQFSRNMLEMHTTLTYACYGVIAKAARYKPIENAA